MSSDCLSGLQDEVFKKMEADMKTENDGNFMVKYIQQAMETMRQKKEDHIYGIVEEREINERIVEKAIDLKLNIVKFMESIRKYSLRTDKILVHLNKRIDDADCVDYLRNHYYKGTESYADEKYIQFLNRAIDHKHAKYALELGLAGIKPEVNFRKAWAIGNYEGLDVLITYKINTLNIFNTNIDSVIELCTLINIYLEEAKGTDINRIWFLQHYLTKYDPYGLHKQIIKLQKQCASQAEEIFQLKAHIEFMPGGTGAEKAKENFETNLKIESKEIGL